VIEHWEVLAYAARRPPGRGFLIRVRDDAGRTGHGEARTLEGFGTPAATLERFMGDTINIGRLIDAVGAGPGTQSPHVPVEALFAAETALADVGAQAEGLSLAEFLGFDRATSVRNSLLVEDAAEGLALLQQGHRQFKIKAQGADRSCVTLLRRLFEESDGEARVRVDANGSWNRDCARRFLDQAPLDAIGFLEQPFAAGDLDSCRWLHDEFDVPVALDEGADSVAAVEAAARAGAAQIVVIKPMYRGLQGALRLAGAAAARGMGVCVTHAMDATVGRLAAMQLAVAADAVCGGTPWPHGLFAPGLTSLADEPALRPDRLELPRGPGLGCSGLRDDRLEFVCAGR